MVNTKQLKTHRKLRFENLDDALNEVDRLSAAERANRLELMGNWTLGQILGHLAAWMNYGFDGVSIKPPPFPIRLVLKFRKNAFLNVGMPRGVNIPGVKGGTLATEPIELADGLQQFQLAADRLKRNCPAKPNIVFGPLTHEEWIKLNLRHAELHLGYAREKI